MPWRTLPRNIPDVDTTKMDASRGTIRWDDHARRAARANGQSGAGRVAVTGDLLGSSWNVVPSRRGPETPSGGAVNWRPWLWLRLILVVIMLMAVAMNFADRESWHWGGPGTRHTEDIEPELRTAWDKICLTCWMRP